MQIYKIKQTLINILEDVEYYKRHFVNPEKYIKKVFYKRMGYPLNLDSPQTFSEKLQWLKLYYHKSLYTMLVDKYEVKQYVKDLIGEQYVIPTIGCWDRVEDIDFDRLPNKFVLKCTHDSGGLVVCKDKKNLDIKKVKKTLSKSLRRNFYYMGFEWPYKNVKPRIIAEEYMEDSQTKELRDYKFSCFDGKVNDVMVCYDRGSGDTKYYFFDKDWNLLPLNKRGKNAPDGFTLPKPSCIDEMFELAGKLSKGLPYARVDLYAVNDHPYFGEITFFPSCGFDSNLLPETEQLHGSMIELPSKTL